MLTLDKIYHASFVLKEVLRRTDLIAAPQIAPDSSIFLKPENLQLTGSFKVRGAYYKISQLSDEEKAYWNALDVICEKYLTTETDAVTTKSGAYRMQAISGSTLAKAQQKNQRA